MVVYAKRGYIGHASVLAIHAAADVTPLAYSKLAWSIRGYDSFPKPERIDPPALRCIAVGETQPTGVFVFSSPVFFGSVFVRLRVDSQLCEAPPTGVGGF